MAKESNSKNGLSKNVKFKEMTKNNGNDKEFNLTAEDKKHLRIFLGDCGLEETQVKLVFTLIAVANGKIKFDTTYDEITTELHTDTPKNAKEKKRRRDNLGDRLREFGKNWREINGIDFFSMGRQCKCMNETTNQRNPHNISLNLIFLSQILDLANEDVTDVKAKFEKLKKVYGVTLR